MEGHGLVGRGDWTTGRWEETPGLSPLEGGGARQGHRGKKGQGSRQESREEAEARVGGALGGNPGEREPQARPWEGKCCPKPRYPEIWVSTNIPPALPEGGVQPPCREDGSAAPGTPASSCLP